MPAQQHYWITKKSVRNRTIEDTIYLNLFVAVISKLYFVFPENNILKLMISYRAWNTHCQNVAKIVLIKIYMEVWWNWNGPPLLSNTCHWNQRQAVWSYQGIKSDFFAVWFFSALFLTDHAWFVACVKITVM